jgi:hypothetical protein
MGRWYQLVAGVVERMVGAVTDVCSVDAVLAMVPPVLGVCVLTVVVADTVLAWRQYTAAAEVRHRLAIGGDDTAAASTGRGKARGTHTHAVVAGAVGWGRQEGAGQTVCGGGGDGTCRRHS